MQKVILFIFGWVCWIIGTADNLYAQELIKQQLNVSTYYEFCKLFNGKQQEVSVWTKFPKLMNAERMNVLQGLFNPMDTAGQDEKQKFAAYCVQHNLMLDQDNMQPLVDLFYMDMHGKEVKITAHMKLKHSDKGDYWGVEDVSSDYFFLGDTSKIGYIGISDNEVGFQVFAHNAGANPYHIAGADYRPDKVALFLFLTANNFLRFERVENERHIGLIGDYTLCISQIIDKKQPVTGWMITGLSYNGRTVFGKIE